MSDIVLLEKFLDYCSVKNRVISKNIANITTENYKAEDVSFNDILNENINSSIRATSPKHLSASVVQNSSPEVVEAEIGKELYNPDLNNNVDIEKEMAELARNTLNYKFATKKIGNYYKTLQAVIKGGGPQ